MNEPYSDLDAIRSDTTIVVAADLEGRSTEVGRGRQAECEEGNNRATVGVEACE